MFEGRPAAGDTDASDTDASLSEEAQPAADIFPGDATEAAAEVGSSPPARTEAARHGWRVLGTLSALMGFASVSTDLYLPAMPEMGRALGADSGTIELTVSGYLIGFSLGQLLWGPISDRHGRRLPVAIGLVLFIIGSAGCALSFDAWSMIGWRVVQAVGASAGVVLGRAMVRDLYEGPRAAQMMSTLMTVMAIAPLIGPLLGGQILAFAGWHAIFWFLVVVGFVTLGAVARLPETLPAAQRNPAPLGRALRGYGALLRERRLLGYAGAGGFFYAAMFAYIAGTPFAYITYHHVPAGLYGVLFAAGIVGIMATNMINARLVMRLGSDRILVGGIVAATASGLLLAGIASADWGGLWGLFVPLFLFVSTTGFIVANSIAGALGGSARRAGAVSALIGAIHYGSGIIGSALVGLLADGTPRPMTWVIALGCIGSLLCCRLLSDGRAKA
ncbi:multidrug effflux MFS transporter [Ancylobacter sp. Lp-2]|uniref:multidrug effflux MFS transporter n=1 Tax=Ancylobacter sp. Lp-2 TaxID=2881339 RepID=UPI001E3211BA|nr:multidrug effflux MFS transporter [Ancylobacter sp. Lp-2]MCB4769095.1 multidrug effflux MFS transporter [Ancylobacter sp. Lp-2]